MEINEVIFNELFNQLSTEDKVKYKQRIVNYGGAKIQRINSKLVFEFIPDLKSIKIPDWVKVKDFLEG